MIHYFKTQNFTITDSSIKTLLKLIVLLLLFSFQNHLSAQSLDIPSKNFGISFGNSKDFYGVRLNWSDREVEQITGVNITLWRSLNNEEARVNGLSIGLMPEAGYIKGIQAGIVGVSAVHRLSGLSVGLLGAGSGGTVNGIALGGLGVGSAEGINGIAIGGLGAGSGGDINGLAVGILGVGSGGDARGVMLGGLGVGSSGNVTGFTFGGLGTGAGGNITGIHIGGIGVGAGGVLKGLAIGGVGVGSGARIKGIALGGIGVGSPKINGVALAGFGVGAEEISGVACAVGMIRIEDHGYFKGISASAFNYIKGRQSGLSIGIVNYASELNGVQLGIINIAKNNSEWLRVLPFINMHL